ncbi:unnamed protein product [Parajaminaea phylloscopi]
MFFQSFFQNLADAAGTPVDYVKLIFLLIISSPIAYPLPLLPASAKHVVCIATSAFFFLGILDLRLGFAQLLGTSLLTYFLAKYQVGGKRMPWIVFWAEMGHLTVNHLVRAFGNIPLTTIEITAMQMVLTMNLTTFAWDVYDGQMRTAEQCDEQQKGQRITEMPSIIEFLGYCFYFPGVLVGPSTRFVDYRAWANGTLYSSPKGKEKETGSSTMPPPGRVVEAVRQLAIGFFFLAIFALFAPSWQFSSLIYPASEGGVSTSPFLWRAWYAVVASFMARTKYYGIWTLTNAACTLSGLSYNGLAPADGSRSTASLSSRTKWNRCQNVDILGVELAQNWKELLDHWNMNTNVWLRNNVYKRVAKPGRKPGFKSTMFTFLTSAFWHGIAPGYYIAFIMGGFCQSVARSLRKSLRPRVFRDPTQKGDLRTLSSLKSLSLSQIFYVSLSIVAVHTTMSHAAMAFILLDVKRTLLGWASLYFYGIWSVLGLMLAFRLGLGKYLSGAKRVVEDPKKREQLPIPDAPPASRAAKEEALRSIQKEIEDLDSQPHLPDVEAVMGELAERAEELMRDLGIEQKVNEVKQ